MNTRWLLRAVLWARNPPSARRVKLMLIVLVACGLLYGIERFIGWPEALNVENAPKGRILK